MLERLEVIILLVRLPLYSSLKCAECGYLPHTLLSANRTCPENCFGEICFIVVNNYYNETLVSGCVDVDSHTRAFLRNNAYCYRKKRYTVCGCTILNRCNSPQAPSSMFTFITTPFFEDCKFVPEFEDEDFNVTCLRRNKGEMELTPRRQHVEKTHSTNEISFDLNTEQIRTASTQVNKSANLKEKTVVQAAHIVVSNFVTKRDKISSKFINNVVRNLLPSTAGYYIAKWEDNYELENGRIEKLRTNGIGNGSKYQCVLSKTLLPLIFAILYTTSVAKLFAFSIETLKDEMYVYCKARRSPCQISNMMP